MKHILFMVMILIGLIGCGTEYSTDNNTVTRETVATTPAEKTEAINEENYARKLKLDSLLEEYNTLFTTNLVRSKDDCDYTVWDNGAYCKLNNSNRSYLWLYSENDSGVYLASQTYSSFGLIGSLAGATNPIFCQLDTKSLKQGAIECTRYPGYRNQYDVECLFGNKDAVTHLPTRQLIRYYKPGRTRSISELKNGIVDFQYESEPYHHIIYNDNTGKALEINDKDCNSNYNYCRDILYELWLGGI